MADFRETLDRFKKDFNLEEFLTGREGYVFSPKDSVRARGDRQGKIDQYEYKVLKRAHGAGGATVLEVGKGPTGHWVYKNLNNDGDKGSVVDYLKNHRALSSMGEMSVFMKENNTACLGAIKAPVPIKPADPVSKIVIASVAPYKENGYFKSRQIQDTIVNNPHISGSLAFVRYGQGKGKFYSTAFRIRDAESTDQTYNLKNSYFKKGRFLGPRNGGFWFARPKTVSQTYIGEAAIDVISYWKTRPVPGCLLVSSEGRVSNKYIDGLKKLHPSVTRQPVTLVNDNDMKGSHYDLHWIAKLYDLPYRAGIANKNGTEYIEFTTDDPSLSRLADHLGGICSVARATELAVIISAHYNLPVKIEKSKGKDWNQDLTAGAGRKKNHGIGL